MASTSSLAKLRARLTPHGYHVFLQPDRPSGWLVILRRGYDPFAEPMTTRAATRDEALALAERFFITHRITELDAAVRSRGLTPPQWDEASQSERLDVLDRFARAHAIDL